MKKAEEKIKNRNRLTIKLPALKLSPFEDVLGYKYKADVFGGFFRDDKKKF